MLRIIAHSGDLITSKVLALDYRITDAYNQPVYSPYWSRLRAHDGLLDTTLVLSFYPRGFNLVYRIVTPDSIYNGIVSDLAMGHLFGIAGQSNAEGWSPPPFADLIGDVRIMRGPRYWEYGANRKRWNSPWIFMANKFRALVPDGLPIGLVNTAAGGTSLVAWSQAGDWKRNPAMPDDPRTIYGKAIRMLRAAGGNMEALFWIQGEADVVSASDSEYRAAFTELTQNFERDLGHRPAFYHSQISGQTGNPGLWRPLGWGLIREAQRDLAPSKLVATAVAYPLSFDAIHYENITMEAIGHRFAAALAHEGYQIRSQLYPPLTVDKALIVDIDSERPELGKRFLLSCIQGAEPAGFAPGRPFRKFELRNGDERFDTSRVSARAHTFAPGWIEVWLRDSTIMDTSGWYVSYAIRADVDGADAVDTCSASVLPNALVAFLDVPVTAGREPERPKPLSADAQRAAEECTYRWFTLLGAELPVSIAEPAAGRGLPPGIYLSVKTCGREVSSGKLVVLPR